VKVFVQAKGESIVINGEITVTIVDILDEDAVLGVDAPKWLEVCEQKTFEELATVPVRPR
jgi:sRNA-binding carbon storage regulator CsrA